ncbi:MAG: butyrate kinase [Synergistaceae bacterium]|nr:butyrate kinase [Synergistaceae bacterium]
MPESFLILAINPGSTSTKTAIYRDEEALDVSVISHVPEEFAQCSGLIDQKPIRMKSIIEILAQNNINMESLDAVVGRGGLVKPIKSGTYTVNDEMIRDLSTDFALTHASALGGIIAAEIGRAYNIPAFVVDPVVVDEMEPYARVSGIPEISRRSVFHALNTKAVARRCAADIGKKYNECRFVVAHMGGGISVGAHKYGMVVDVNDALYGEGPFSPERCGGLPVEQVVQMCFSGKYSKEEMIAFTVKKGGMRAYLGTNDLRTAEKNIAEGDEKSALIVDAMAYQVAREIGSMGAVLEFKIDAVILTGGLARSRRFTDQIKQRLESVSSVMVYPGEDEMTALALGALRVLRKEERAAVYV